MSVGLERLFQASTGIKVRGYEVNRAWWESPHSALRFIKLSECVVSLRGLIFTWCWHMGHSGEYGNKRHLGT